MRHASPSSVDIVLCADQVIFAEALQYALACAGHNVTAVCSSAAELASAVRLARPRVCITDFQLSDGDVLAALREIRLNCPDCRVIILTDHAGNSMLRWSVAAVVDSFVAKSAGLGVLLDAVGRVCEGETVIAVSDAAPSAVQAIAAHKVMNELTKRETECFALLVAGMDTYAMSTELGVSRTTVRTHVQSLLGKLGVHSRLEAAALAVSNDILGESPSMTAALLATATKPIPSN